MSSNLIVVLLIAPLVGFLINGLFGKWLKGNEKLSGGIGALAVLVSLICSIIAFVKVQGENTLKGDDGILYKWISSFWASSSISISDSMLTN